MSAQDKEIPNPPVTFKGVEFDINNKDYQIRLLKAIRTQMSKAKSDKTTNIMLVRDTLLLPTSKGGRTNAYMHCSWLGIDPDACF